MKFMRILMCFAALLAGNSAVLALNSQNPTVAKPNVIESLAVSKAGGNTVLKVSLRETLAATPANFVITNPARIVFDFPATDNGLGYNNKTINEGGLRSFSVVQAGDRSRLVLNLDRISRFDTRQEGKFLLITLLDEGSAAAGSTATPVQHFAPSGKDTTNSIRDIQFRRNKDGSGVVLVDLSTSESGIDVRQKGSNLLISFKKTRLPDTLRRRLDVVDFATPVTAVNTRTEGDDVNIEIVPRGLWEHTAYQSDAQFIVEVRPVKEDANKLFQGSRKGYQGDAISLNFQNIPLRELLHVFADITNFNIVVSDSVSGNVSLRLNDVPWDQALEIVLQQKNLAMRKSGSVLWIAPQDELAARDEQLVRTRESAFAADPPRLELFQLNYMKAEDFVAMISVGAASGAAGGGGEKAGIKAASNFLSPVGNVTIDKRTNQVFIYDIPTKLDLIGTLLKQIDRPVRQVLIEARIVEADTNFSKQLGVRIGGHDHQGLNVGHKVLGQDGLRFGLSATSRDAYTHLPEGGAYPATAYLTGGGAGTPPTAVREVPPPTLADSQFSNNPMAATPAGQFALTLFNSAKTQLLTLELQALEADGKGKTISSPRIMTMDQMEATIQQGVRIPYQIATASGATSIAWQDAALSLKVKPHITPDGRVMMKLVITKNSIDLTRASSAFIPPTIKTQETISDVLVENGGTVVIGGIFKQDEFESTQRVPFLGDLPYVGFLFKTKQKSDNRVEVLIMITPKIMDDAVVLR
ncbi:MAG: type IV pilus secretin PilQ [Rhodocyclaceae bacterium]|nr:type IV pilus secretin PilQ [Rhodocyclaceae bacterium]